MEPKDVEKLIREYFVESPLDERDVLHYAGEPVCVLTLHVRDSEILLNSIRVLDGHERRGHATNAMTLLKQISELSKYQISGIIEPNGKRHMNHKQLAKWYKSLGFTEKNGSITYFPRSMY